MAISFCEKFNKAVFKKRELEVIDRITDFGLKLNKEQQSIAVDAEFDGYVEPERIFAVEAVIKSAYKLNQVRIYPHFKGVRFSTDNMDGIIRTLVHFSDVFKGFFDDCSYSYNVEEKHFVITLRPYVTAYFVNRDSAVSFIEECVKAQFGDTVRVEIKDTKFDVESYAPSGKDQLYEDVVRSIREVEREKPLGNSGEMSISLSDSESDKDAEYFTDEGGKKLVKVGFITLDITEPQKIMGSRKSWKLTPISRLEENTTICVGGKFFLLETKERYDGNDINYTLYLTDLRSSVTVRFKCDKNDPPKLPKTPAYLLVAGKVKRNKHYDRDTERLVTDEDITISADAIYSCTCVERTDKSIDKRVELHLHTNMSALDALPDPADVMALAAKWGMPAVAFTDHGTLQSYPIVMSAAKKYPTVKPIYGMEGYIVDDTARAVFRYNDEDNIPFADSEFVIFDIETTGLSAKNCGITQIGALRFKDGEILDRFETYVNPGMPIPQNITELTGITDAMVANAPSEEEAVKQFLEFSGDRMLVAHNAGFDVSFISRVATQFGIPFTNTYLDTVSLSRYINSDISRHSLDALARYYKLGSFDHHRATDDTDMLARIFTCMIRKLAVNGIYGVADMNEAMAANADPKRLKYYHISILVKNAVGLKNLYKLVSRSYIDYFHGHPRIPKTLLAEYREGLVIGSACSSGELYSAILDNKSFGDLLKIADFYDYFEIQPHSNNGFLIEDGKLGDNRELAVKQLEDNVRKIISVADKQGKPVVATGDVHFLHPEDEIYRQIMLFGMKYGDAFRETKLFFRTTEEMLDEFSYLGEEKAREVVIYNPQKIIADFESIKPIPDGTFTPSIEGAEEELESICLETAHEMYGDPLPEIVKNRMERELSSIIKNGFAVLYVIARRLVKNSEEHGYLVGSRGSVGSSFVATLAKISEVNPLPPHYVCPKCKHSVFEAGKYGSGFDMPDRTCDKCGTLMNADGHDIPFETFLGFHGEKAPDIDLNFSGDVQSEAHKFTEVLFGSENIFRAGTVGTLQDKNCFGFVKKYLEDKQIGLPKAEVARLANGFVGVRRTTGQHPGGIVVIPKEYEIYDFTPVQYPANKASSGVITTHFAFEYLHDTLLKLDILGHDVPTFYHILEKYTGIDVRTVKMNDQKVIDLFASTEPLGVTPEQIQCKIGTLGLPEFGTDYAIQMIIDAKPKNFSDLLQISGLSHGTGIWLGNGKDLIQNGTCTIDEIIGTRDSIMLYLMRMGLDSATAFNAMERTRKGKGLTPEIEAEMREHSVPEWYIDSCNKIQYMFPKAHAAAYTIASMRIGWFKVYRPIEYYATYFTVKYDNFDGELVMKGLPKIEERIKALSDMPNKTAKEEDSIVFLNIVREMFARGIKFLPVSVTKSEAIAFVPENGKIRLPLCSLNGLGQSVAEKICETVKSGDATTVEELRVKAGVNKSIMELLEKNNCFGDLPESDQVTMF